MQKGTKVIRKSDISKAITAFGTIERIIETSKGAKATVVWHYNYRDQHSTLLLKALVEVTPELETEIREAARHRILAERAERDKERIYVCNNINPNARVAHEGHPRPLHLMPSQVKDGRCIYCHAEAVLREQVEVETK